MKCPYCAATDHETPEACPRVSAIEYEQAAGTLTVRAIRRIEFFPPTIREAGRDVGYVESLIPL